MNTLLTLQYNGSKYSGFQRQINSNAVQNEVESALSKLLGKTVEIVGCSRTDSGVHALKYYCNFKKTHHIPMESLPYAINRFLPEDIRILFSQIVDDDFSARFSTVSKTYAYAVYCGDIMPPFLAKSAFHFPHNLDIGKMQNAARDFIGTHNFEAFMAKGSNQTTPIRTVNSLSVCKKDDMIIFEINADSYLYKMVRTIVGTLLYVGNGKICEDAIPYILHSKNRVHAGITVIGDGLYLKDVYYGNDILH